MKVSYVVGISVSVVEFLRVLEGVRGAVFLRELGPGQVVVVCDDDRVRLDALDGVLFVREDRPRPLDR